MNDFSNDELFDHWKDRPYILFLIRQAQYPASVSRVQITEMFFFISGANNSSNASLRYASSACLAVDFIASMGRVCT